MTKGLQRIKVTRWVRLLVLVGLGTVLLLSESRIKTAIAQAPSTPLNIIVIKTDDQRWDTLWAMPMVQQELVRRGVTFTNAFVSTPLCCPERASFLAGGLYAHNTGVLANKYPNGGASKFVDTATLPVRLQRIGYKTAMLGKYLNQYGSLRGPPVGPTSPQAGQNSFKQSEGTT